MINYYHEYLNGQMSLDEALVGCKNLLNRDSETEELNQEELSKFIEQENVLTDIVVFNYMKEQGWVREPNNDIYTEYVRGESKTKLDKEGKKCPAE